MPASATQPPSHAPYASCSSRSRGRRHGEPEDDGRGVFQRDRDRIVHCVAFRRLQYKTQVFVYHEGDHYRTRLTHSLEVSQIARSLARALSLDEDLAEAVALAHDLGHPPFGHAGEAALDTAMSAYGGFDHNAQTLRVLTRIERRYAAFDGLNLTWETLEGIAKHNGPLIAPSEPMSEALRDLEIDLTTQTGLEAQIAALADDIAYNNHDLDDGLRAGLFGFDDLRDLPLVGPVIEEIESRQPAVIDPPRRVHETIRRLISLMINDLVAETQKRLSDLKPQSADDIRLADSPAACFSEPVQQGDLALKAFLRTHMYRHPRVMAAADQGRDMVIRLFENFHADHNRMPEEWSSRAACVRGVQRARLVSDYIAGMTDRYAQKQHDKLQ